MPPEAADDGRPLIAGRRPQVALCALLELEASPTPPSLALASCRLVLSSGLATALWALCEQHDRARFLAAVSPLRGRRAE